MPKLLLLILASLFTSCLSPQIVDVSTEKAESIPKQVALDYLLPFVQDCRGSSPNSRDISLEGVLWNSSKAYSSALFTGTKRDLDLVLYKDLEIVIICEAIINRYIFMLCWPGSSPYDHLDNALIASLNEEEFKANKDRIMSALLSLGALKRPTVVSH